jgi:RNA polymerase sigma-70 factor (ECF subfamily)
MKRANTEVCPGEAAFPKTRWSVIRETREPDLPKRREALDSLAAIYWRPIYAYLRRKWGRTNEEAKDLTQDFFLTLCETEFLGRIHSGGGLFRSYVMATLDNFVGQAGRRASTLKRGGGTLVMPLQDSDAWDVPADTSPEEAFSREWARAILDDAMNELKKEYLRADKETLFEVFFLYDFESAGELTYDELSARSGLAVGDITNALYRARKRLRELVWKRVQDTAATTCDAGEEMRSLFLRPAP